MKGVYRYGRSRCKRTFLPRADHADSRADEILLRYEKYLRTLMYFQIDAKENVEKYAKSQGKKPTSKEVGDEFEIVIE